MKLFRPGLEDVLVMRQLAFGIRHTRRGDLITNKLAVSTQPWFHFPVGTPMERITVRMAPKQSADELARLRALKQ